MKDHTNNRMFLLALVMGFILAVFSLDAVVHGHFNLFGVEMGLAVVFIVGGQLLFPALSEEGSSLPAYHNYPDEYQDEVSKQDYLWTPEALLAWEELAPVAIVVDVTHTHLILHQPDTEKLASYPIGLFPAGQCHAGERIAWTPLEDLLFASGELSKLDAERIAEYESFMLQQHIG